MAIHENLMVAPPNFDDLDSRLADLCRLVRERAPAEAEIVVGFEEARDTARKTRAKALESITDQYESDSSVAEAAYAKARRLVIERFDAESRDAERGYQSARQEMAAVAKSEEAALRESSREKHWEAYTVAEAVKNAATIELREANARIVAQVQQAAAVRKHAEVVLCRYRQRPAPSAAGSSAESPPARLESARGSDSAAASAKESAPDRQLGEQLQAAQQQYQRLAELSLPQLFQGARPAGFFVLVFLALVVPTALLAGPNRWPWIVGAVAAAGLVFGVGVAWLHQVAGRMCEAAHAPLRKLLFEIESLVPTARAAVQARYEHTVTTIAAKQAEQATAADAALRQTLAKHDQERASASAALDTNHAERMTQMAVARDRRLEAAEARYSERMAEIHRQYREASERVERDYAAAMLELDQRHQRQWGELTDRWFSGLQQFDTVVDDCNRWCDVRFPDWNGPEWRQWSEPRDIPSVVRIGRSVVQMAEMEGGLPTDERLRVRRAEFAFPTLLPFPSRSLLVLDSDRGRCTDQFALMQSILLRMLTALPPGKLRMTIVDPVGLGENFAAFMHLADFDEKLVASRIWTDKSHIEQRLADLTAHMENVLQVYLRNTFSTIEEYNAFAGEMAEPYQLLVVADFPVGFSESAAARLKSIVASGARCGVFTLLSLDRSLPLPRGFQWSDLAPHTAWLTHAEGRFSREHEEYGKLFIDFPQPPPPEQFTAIVRAVGGRVEEAGRVEVPFATVAPEPAERWTADSRGGIDIPLGRAGATRLQHLRLGKGTSQHVLISGKSGSGKSTLLHALITNIALRYSPDEVELYLIDFKKGVEFKAYADGRLPHARVVAIESEREFGLSVLARLDDELRRRGDRFRELRVQDIRGFRNALPEQHLPRILLMIDEFQELFVEDDRLAQEAGLLLDRLVRQGRAFGIHILLGSQTLSGAYSLARSTIGQMAVRIALQCSEADSHLILSEDNTAARLLTRPGEAIYNDANGLFEGNHPFQVAWLPDKDRDQLLGELHQMAENQGQSYAPPIVFEGNAPADLAENPLLVASLAAERPPYALPAAHAWLGSPVAIKGPTSAVFVRQGGSNLLVVGQDDRAALGVLASAVVSLSAQHGPQARFYVFDGMRPDAAHADAWQRVAEALPHDVRRAAPNKAAGLMAELFAECARREAEDDERAPSIFFVVYHLARFRDLLKGDDDFGFGRFDADKPASPAQQLAEVLRRGPAVGVHGLIWCDGYNAVGRALDRQTLRDVELRVLFRMNASDSSALIDSPVAARLSEHRALLHDEGQGQSEKFRPFAPPSDACLAWLKQQCGARQDATILPIPRRKSAQ